MRRIHLIGGKNHGKTTLLTELIGEFRRRGLRVGSIKHTHHQHELDTPGKDSYRHRESGAIVVGILSRTMNAVFWSPAGVVAGEERYAEFVPAFAGCDLILVEGDTQTRAPKLEVWRAELETVPLSERLADVVAVVTDDPVTTSLPVLARGDLVRLADFILELLSRSMPDS